MSFTVGAASTSFSSGLVCMKARPGWCEREAGVWDSVARTALVARDDEAIAARCREQADGGRRRWREGASEFGEEERGAALERKELEVRRLALLGVRLGQRRRCGHGAHRSWGR